MSEPQEITFQSGLPQIGQITLFTSEEETRLLFTGKHKSDGAPVRAVSTSRSRRVRREEILAVGGIVAERLRVAFIEDVTTNESNGKKERAVGPFAGKTFEIERKADRAALVVYDAGGAPARFGVAAQIAGLYRDFGRADAAVKLPVGPQRIGQSSPELAQTIIANVSRGATISQVQVPGVTLVDIVPGPEPSLHGLYQLDVKIAGASGGSKISMTLRGTLTLRDVDGAALEMKLQGSVRSEPEVGFDGAVDPRAPPGAGEFKLTQSTVYART